MAVITIRDGGLVTLDPSDVRVFNVDWDDNLASGVTISSSSFTLTLIRGASSPALTKDQESILSGSRRTQVRLATIAEGALYQVDNRITTSESPAQTKERHFKVLGQTK